MARADLVKKLFISFKTNDDEDFLNVANDIIEDERKKNHSILANELKKIINDNSLKKNGALRSFHPKVTEENDMRLFQVFYPEKYFTDVFIKSSNVEQLEQIITEFRNWDVLVSNGAYPTRRILFYGPPGCGKTITAQAVASEIGIPLLYVRFDAVISSYLGETASNIGKIFEFAEDDQFVIFFDEFDAIARSRNDQYEHGEIKRVVNTFLQQLDNFKGKSLVIAATNFEQALDYAIWRRFDSTLHFGMPSVEEKKSLFSYKLKQFKGPKHVFGEFMDVMDNFSHSDVEQVCNMILKICILKGSRMYTKRDVEKAILLQESYVLLRKTQY